MEPLPAPHTHAESEARDESALDLATFETSRTVHESVALASGRTVVVRGDGDGERVVFRNPDGEVELTVRLTREGPVLSLRAVALSLDAKDLSVDVDRLTLRARKDVSVETLGSVETRVLGDQRAHVQGAASLDAASVTVNAHRGGVNIEGAEDVRIDGAAVRLNC